HCRFRLGYLKNRSVASFRFHTFDYIDHARERGFPQRCEKSGMAQHGLFHQRIAGTNRYTMPAGDATGFADRGTAIPEHARIWIFPVDRKRFVDLDVLAGFYAAPAQDALIGIVAIERVGVIHLVWLWPKWDSL